MQKLEWNLEDEEEKNILIVENNLVIAIPLHGEEKTNLEDKKK